MKHEIGIVKPDCLVEDWPGKYEVFHWLEYVITLPNPIFIITTRKANGAANANLHSWGLLIGDKGHYTSLLALHTHTHTFANIQREHEWCINIPSFEHINQCERTIQCNAAENDEIVDSGFTLEPSRCVQAPRIAECIYNLECVLEWDQSVAAGGLWHLFAGRVVHAAAADAGLIPDPIRRMQALQLMYNIRSTINPLDGSYYGPNTFGLISQIHKTVPDNFS
jgi:flavin reductase (DIM6/NTAB) family NADH-FMN oxidoreductase RutF